MSKAIKHIKAGLLHIEVIGTIPDRPPGRQGRAARSRGQQQTARAETACQYSSPRTAECQDLVPEIGEDSGGEF